MIGFGCKGKESFDETSSKSKRESDQGSYEGCGNCDGNGGDGERGVDVATGSRGRSRLCCGVFRRRSTTLCSPCQYSDGDVYRLSSDVDIQIRSQ